MDFKIIMILMLFSVVIVGFMIDWLLGLFDVNL